MTSRAAVFAANFAALYAAHQYADHMVQDSDDATRKQNPGPDGARACATHVTTYTATTMLATVAVNRVLGIRLGWKGWLAGQAVSAATHYLADRGMQPGKPFRRVLDAHAMGDWIDTGGVVRLEGGPAETRGPGTAAYAVDQAWHTVWLAVAALITARFSRH